MCAAEAIDVEEIEAGAAAVLEAVPEFVWDGETLPIPVEEIVDTCFGLLVRDVEDMTAAPVPGGLGVEGWISGLLLPARGEIWVNAEDARRWPPRRRFTICHELGHWQLHRTPGQQSLFCRAGHVEPAESGPGLGLEDERPVAEVEADAFAASMLLPRHLLDRHRAECGDDVVELCRRFDSSEKAMRRRLEIR